MKRWLILLLILFSLPVQSAWYNNSWLYRQKISIKHTQVDADLSNFPVYVNLSNIANGTGLWTAVKISGADIRVTSSDGTTEVPIDLVWIDKTNSEGELYFKAASLANSSNSDFYLYYGNNGASAYVATATYGARNVWTNSYVSVFHMHEDPSGTAPQMKNSYNTANGTSAGTMTSGDKVSGKFGNSIDFDGTDDRITFSDSGFPTGNSARTVSCWVYAGASHNSFAGHISYGTSAARNGWSMIYNGASNNLLIATNAMNSTTASSGSISASSWTKLDITYDGTTVRYYLSGSASGTSTFSGTPSTKLNSGYIASSPWGDYYTGRIDEVRFSSVERSSTWISTEANNQTTLGNFYNINSQEDRPPLTNMVEFSNEF